MNSKKLILIIPTLTLLFSCANTSSTSLASSNISSTPIASTPTPTPSPTTVAPSTPTPTPSPTTVVTSTPTSTPTPTPSGPICVTDSTKYKLPVPELEEEQTTYTIPNSDKTITKGEWYTTLEEVAAYVLAFKFLPDNYYLYETQADRTVCGQTYGMSCRLYKDTYSNSPGYNSPILTDGATKYYEADLENENGTYSPSSRGVYRVVFSVDAGHEILYYTDDHYDHFTEYFNYYGGWGNWFGDNSSSKHPFSSIWQAGIVVDEIDFSCFIKED